MASLSGKALEELVIIEVFAGTARVSSALRFFGMKSSFGVDHIRHRCACAPISIVDLTTARGQQLLRQWMQNPNVIALFLAPPCGTASRARSIRLKAARFGGPKPLRSDAQPNGVSNLSFIDKIKVSKANQLYHFCAQLVQEAIEAGMIVCVENPQFSHFWATTFWVKVAGLLQYTVLHSCQFGSTRQKKTMLAHNDCSFHLLHRLCPGESKTHRHAQWGLTKEQKFATADETAYPFELARDIANIFVIILLKNGIKPPPQLLSDVTPKSDQVLQALRAQTGTQPRAARLPPLVPEFKCFVKRPANQSLEDVPNAKRVARNPFASSRMKGGMNSSLESGQETIGVPTTCFADSEHNSCDNPEEVWGVYHDPMEFIQKAAETGHPQNLNSCLPEVLRKAVRVNADTTELQRARARTELILKWKKLARDLEPQEKKLKESMPSHLQVILGDKKIMLWERLLKDANYPDMQVVQEFVNGTKLTGETEFCGLWPSKFSPAIVSEDELSEISKRDKSATLTRVANSPNPETDQQVWQNLSGVGW